MSNLPDHVQRATSREADMAVPTDYEMDRTRSFDTCHPPEKILTWRGEYVRIAWRNDESVQLQRQFAMFMDRIAAHEREAEVPESPVEKTIVYEQDGLSFDAEGMVIPEVLDYAGRQRAARKIAAERAQMAARKAAVDAMREAGYDDITIENFTLPSFTDNATGKRRLTATDVVTRSTDGTHFKDGTMLQPKPAHEKVDLVGWARGAFELTPYELKKAFREQHSVNIKNAEHAREWLKENSMIA